MRKFIALALLAACTPVATAPVSVTPQMEAAARSTITGALRNPASAVFGQSRAFQTEHGETVICLQVNAENGFGGMTGMQWAYVSLYEGRGPIPVFDDVAQLRCAGTIS